METNRAGAVFLRQERIAEMTNEEIIFKEIQAPLGLTDEEKGEW